MKDDNWNEVNLKDVKDNKPDFTKPAFRPAKPGWNNGRRTKLNITEESRKICARSLLR